MAARHEFQLIETRPLFDWEIYRLRGRHYEVKKSGEQWLRQTLAGIKRAIDEHTRPGDIVMIEHNRKVWPEDFQKKMPKYVPKVAEALARHHNLYYQLARHARARGRQVILLEEAAQHKSRTHSKYLRHVEAMEELEWKEMDPNEAIELGRLGIELQGLDLVKWIKRNKPRLVIASPENSLSIRAHAPKHFEKIGEFWK